LNDSNPRFIKDDKFEKLCKSIQETPNLLSKVKLKVDFSDGGKVLGGNMRLRALTHLKYKEIPESWVEDCSDLTEEEKRKLIIIDNASFGAWDFDALANDGWDVEELADWGIDIPNFEVEQLAAVEDDFDGTPPEEPKTVLGDLYEIGEHRLLCGSSTEADAVKKLLQGKEPYLMVTDPPYGVKYDADWRNNSLREDGTPIGGRAIGKVSNDDNADWTEAWALSPSKVAYVYQSDKHVHTVAKSLIDCDFQIRNLIIWVKNNFAISRGDYHSKHETCWYAVKKGSKGNWASDRKQTTVWEIAKPQKSETGHSTQKPIECMAKAIANHDGDVHDPFLGSGTTMVASHQLKRKCYGMELDPKYCDVIVKRMITLDPSLTIKLNGVDVTNEWKQ
ncbi:MAG: hypothetical protein RL308_3440, partial [Bacteroidota bacterium]